MRASLSKLLKCDTHFEYKWDGDYIFDPEAHDEDPTTGVYHYILFTDAIVRNILMVKYGERIFNDYDSDSEDIDDLLENYKQTWRCWIASRDQEIGPLMYALSLKYNPIENYHSSEIKMGTVKDTTSQTLEFTDRKDIETDDSYTEHSYTGYKETEKINETTTTGYGSGNTAYKETYVNAEQTRTSKISADDAVDFVNSAQDIDAQHTDSKTIENDITNSRQTGVNGNTKEITGSWKDAHGIPEDGQGHVLQKTGVETTRNGGQVEDNYTIEKYGNIGVTTTQQMLESSYELAKRSVVYIMIREFCELYTYISEEVD